MRIARLCLLLLLLMIPLLGGQAGVTPLAVFGVLAAFGWLGWATERDTSLPARFPLYWPLAALIAVTVVATFTSVYTSASVLGIWQVAVLAGAVLLAAAVPLDRRQLFAGVLAFCLGLLATIIYGWFQWGSWLASGHGLSWRILSTWENPNYYAPFLLLGMPSLLVLARRSRHVMLRWGFGLLAFCSLATLVMTQSRGGVLALLLCLLVFLPAWGWVEGRLSARTLGLGAVGFVILIGLMLLSPLGKRVLDPAVRARQLHSQMFRYYTWQGSLRLLRDYPVLGAGPNTFPSVFGKYQEVGYTRNAHSIYLMAATETGVVGLLVLLWLFGAVLVPAWRAFRAPGKDDESLLRRSLAIALFAGTLGLLLHGCLDADWGYPGIQLTLLLSVVGLWRLDPKFAVHPAGRARVLLPAVMLLVAVLLLPGAYARLYADRAVALTRPEERDQRAEVYRQAVRLAPTNTAYLREAGLSVPRAEGEKLLARAQRLEPTNPANWLYLGKIAVAAGDDRTALAAMTAAEEKQPYLFPALLGIAQACWKLGDIAGCRAALAKILRTQGGPRDIYRPIEVPEPFYTQAWYALADLDLQKGDRQNAVREFARALESGQQFTAGFTEEAQAQALLQGDDGGQNMVRITMFLAHKQLETLLRATEPSTAQTHHNEAESLRETYFSDVPAKLMAEIPATPFP